MFSIGPNNQISKQPMINSARNNNRGTGKTFARKTDIPKLITVQSLHMM